MRTLFFVSALLGLFGCASEGPPRLYDQNDMELAAANGARMGCSCMFVMERDEEYCRAWIKASPNVAKVTFYPSSKKVEASVFISWAATAHYVDDQVGCVLE
ncbi:MAG: hypothetical protein AB1938_22895 [Myxococcota bacterium]